MSSRWRRRPPSGLRDLAERATNELLQRPRVQALWENSNREAHELLLQILEGGGPAVSTEGGVVTLDVRALLEQLAERTGVGAKAAARIPPDAAQITILKSDQLGFAQDVADSLRPLAILLLALMLVFFGGAIALARGHRRETVRAVGFGLIVAGALALLLRTLGGDAVVNALATTEAVRPAAESVWEIATSLLVQAATATIGYGVVMVFAAWLAGPSRAAVATRHALAPYLRRPEYAWGGTALIVVLVLLWSPTPGTRSFVPALLLTALLALGVEALRRLTAREFPDATTPGFGPAMRRSWERMRGAPERLRAVGDGRRTADGLAAPAEPVEPVDPLVRLERLADLHDRGALTDAEFSDQKQELLAAR